MAATTPRGTLVAVFDLRHRGQGDLPADIDVGMMRSEDRGETWSRPFRILDFDATTPFTLTRWSDGTVSLEDTTTSRRVNLDAFGPDNARPCSRSRAYSTAF